MAGLTQAEAQAILDALIALSLNFTINEEQEIVGRKVKFRSVQELTDAIKEWDSIVKGLEAQSTQTGRRMRNRGIG